MGEVVLGRGGEEEERGRKRFKGDQLSRWARNLRVSWDAGLLMLKPGLTPANQDWVVSPEASPEASLHHLWAPWILSSTLTHIRIKPSLPKPRRLKNTSGSLAHCSASGHCTPGAAPEGTPQLTRSSPQGLGLRPCRGRDFCEEIEAHGPTALLEEAGEVQPSPPSSARAWARLLPVASGLAAAAPHHRKVLWRQGTQLCYLSTVLEAGGP